MLKVCPGGFNVRGFLLLTFYHDLAAENISVLHGITYIVIAEEWTTMVKLS